MKYAVVRNPKKRNHVPFRDQVGEVIKTYKGENENIYTLKFGDIEEYFSEDEIWMIKEKEEKIDTTLKHLKNFKNIKRENYPNDIPMIPQGYDKNIKRENYPNDIPMIPQDYDKNIKRENYSNDIPMIPQDYDVGIYDKPNNNSVFYSWEESSILFPVCEYFNNNDFLHILKYIHGDFFRNINDARRNKNKVINSTYKNFEKMKDWASIERAIFNDESLNRGTVDNIKLSKFANHKKFKHYYKICCNSEFNTCSIEKHNIVPSAILCFDYASGNFFTTKSEAENSVMYKKIKTFFKEQKNSRI